MKIKAQELAEQFRIIRGDSTNTTPDDFIVNCVNWCFRDLPMIPRLEKLFSKHNKYNLDANNHWRWKINGNFRRLSDIPMLTFWTSTGCEPCRLDLCYQEPETFYRINGLVELRQAGEPCSYTIETEGDDSFIVFDRPLNIPIIIDIMTCGFPTPIKSLDEDIEISSIAEQLMLNVMSHVWLQEAEDFAFAGAIYDYMDNKLVPEAIQMLNKRWSAAPQAILGEVA